LPPKRNLFEIDNARNLSIQELVTTFIPTQSFWRLLSAKHHIVLGARGQGKTALAKMLSHDHLVLLAEAGDRKAQAVVRGQEYIGIYLPTRLEWVGGLKNKPWLSEAEREQLFQWRLNIASCIAFIPIAISCIANYVEGESRQAFVERKLAHLLSKTWIVEDEEVFDDLKQLRYYLEDTDYRRQIQILRERACECTENKGGPIGMAFGLELFAPLRQGIRQLSRLISINARCAWLLCLDEAEFLKESDHRIINSHMRAYPDNLFFKMTTMPYRHHTLATNIGPPIVNGQDFEYVNIDSDRVLTARVKGEKETIGTLFGRRLFKKLMSASHDPYGQMPQLNPKILLNIDDVLGSSPVLDYNHESWGLSSENMRLLKKYASVKTFSRATRLLGTKEFHDQISRKMQGAIILRENVKKSKGNKSLTVYSGARMAIRCADDNPRYLIRIYNALLMQEKSAFHRCMRTYSSNGKKIRPIEPQVQTQAMQTLSARTLNQVRSYPEVGPELHAFLCMLGKYMKFNLHERPLTTDQITSVKIDSSISDDDWKLMQIAVDHGLLHPNIGAGKTDEMPWKEGVFHLAYSLAPHFLLLPRKGKSRKLTAFQGAHSLSGEGDDITLNKGEQLLLFKGSK